MFDWEDGVFGCSKLGCGSGFLGVDNLQFEFSIVPGATTTYDVESDLYGFIPCDVEYPYYDGQECNPFVRPWETSFSISAYGEPDSSHSNQRTLFVGGIDSKVTIECKPDVETVYGFQRQIVLIPEASQNVKRAGGAPVDFQAEFKEPELCPGYSIDMFDAQGFGWHYPGKFSYTSYALDNGEDLLAQGTLTAGSSEHVEVSKNFVV
jgi:hypothetical protein